MDKKIANNLIVGVFVLIGTLVFLFVLFTIGDGGGVLSRQATLQAKFTHVKGLNYGSEVSLAGLRVGTVKKISVADNETKELTVDMAVSKDMMDKIRQDSVASIRTSGMLGDKYIEISIGTPSMPGKKSGDSLQSEEPEDLFAKGGTMVESIAAEFKRGGDIHELIINLNRVSQNLAFITGEMKTQKGMIHELIYGTSGVKLSKSMDHLEGIMGKINSGQGTLGALVNDPTVYEDLKTMMGGAKRSTVLKYFMQKFIQDGGEAEQAEKKK